MWSVIIKDLLEGTREGSNPIHNEVTWENRGSWMIRHIRWHIIMNQFRNIEGDIIASVRVYKIPTVFIYFLSVTIYPSFWVLTYKNSILSHRFWHHWIFCIRGTFPLPVRSRSRLVTVHFYIWVIKGFKVS